jgi:hypothetical protein
MCRIPLAATALTFLGCWYYHVAPPAQVTVETPADTVATRALAYFAKNNLPAHVEQPSGIIVSAMIPLTDEQEIDWLSCSNSAWREETRSAIDIGNHSLGIYFKVFLRPTGDSVRVRVKMILPPSSQNPDACSSTGKFEHALLASLTGLADSTGGR